MNKCSFHIKELHDNKVIRVCVLNPEGVLVWDFNKNKVEEILKTHINFWCTINVSREQMVQVKYNKLKMLSLIKKCKSIYK